MPWIESHTELARHPKTLRLAECLGIRVPEAIGLLHLLWWWATDFAQDGDLSGFTDRELAAAMQWEGNAGSMVDALLQGGVLSQSRQLADWRELAGHDRRVQRAMNARFGPPPMHPVRRAWQAIRNRIAPLVFARDGFRCVACGAGEELEIDHLIPIARGGTNEMENLQTLCFTCNRAKGAS